jgi:glycosyltransferase involved in cell wall biosynthesis
VKQRVAQPARRQADGASRHDGDPVHLLFVVNELRWFFTHRLPLARAALERGWRVSVAAPPSDASVRLPDGITWHPVPVHRGAGTPLAELRAIRSLITLYRREKPDIVHHVTTKPVLYGAMAARAARVPAVVNAIAGLGYIFMSEEKRAVPLRLLATRLYRAVLRRPNTATILQNEDDLREFTQRRLLASTSVVVIRGAGVDLDEFRPSPEPAGPVTFALVGRMLRDKGVQDFVEAARTLRAEGVEARFVLVGEPDPPNPTSLAESQLRAWVAEGVVEWLGQREDMPEVVRSAHVIVLPSYREGLPKVLLEGAASGRAVITNDVPGCRECVVAGETGLLVPARNPIALADAMRALVADPERRREMGRRGRQYAEQHFGVAGVVRATLQVYDDLLARSAAR